MCGICGFNWKDKKLIKSMNDVIQHRGPDQDGVYCCKDISFGHRRLSIIDLSEHGRQPMFNEDKTICMVFNGEIYNYEELKPQLIALGHKFISDSDSEVIIHAYEEYGIDVLDKLRGMFAFSIWDSKKELMFLARDRIGIKPLYYYHKGDKFLFGSEIKSILEDATVPRVVNLQAMYDYIGFEFVPAPQTMFKDIYKVPAGHYLILKGDQLEMKQYWDMSLVPAQEELSFEESVEREKEELEYAVKSHLMSDVPLGVFLSGGLDSSALVAMMRKHITGPLKTFTIGYNDKTFSEVEYAKQVADYFDTEHHVLILDKLKPDYVEKALWHLDEPMTDLSAVPLFLLCEQVKQHATVCLSGEGGDESFAGYDRFKASRMDSFYRYVPAPLRNNLINKMVHALPDQAQKKGAINMLKRFIEGTELPREAGHLRWQYFSNEKQDAQLFKGNIRQGIDEDRFRLIRDYAEKCDATDRINSEVYLDMRFMMTDSVLMKVDKMSMASSLEVRVPLLDHKFVEYMAGLPGDWKLKGMRTKHVFREALNGMLPDNIVNRGKQGYSLPVKNLLRGQLKEYMIDLLNNSSIIKETMDIDFVNHLIKEHDDMVHNHNHVLWALINIAIWQQKFNVQVG